MPQFKLTLTVGVAILWSLSGQIYLFVGANKNASPHPQMSTAPRTTLPGPATTPKPSLTSSTDTPTSSTITSCSTPITLPCPPCPPGSSVTWPPEIPGQCSYWCLCAPHTDTWDWRAAEVTGERGEPVLTLGVEGSV